MLEGIIFGRLWLIELVSFEAVLQHVENTFRMLSRSKGVYFLAHSQLKHAKTLLVN